MSYEEDGGATRPQFGDAPLEPFHVLHRERRGRLVEQQDPRLARDGSGDLKFLAQRERAVANFALRIDRKELKPRERRVGPTSRPATVEHEPEPRRRLAEQKIVLHGEIRNESDLLKGGRDPERPRAACTGHPYALAEHRDRSRVRTRQPAQDTD